MEQTGTSEYAIKTLHSEILDKFYQFYQYNDGDVHEIMEDIPLSDINSLQYAQIVCFTFMVDSDLTLAGVPDDKAEKFYVEAYDQILQYNPCLDPSHIVQTHVKTMHTHDYKVDVDPVVEYARIKKWLEDHIVGQREAIDRIVRAVGRGLLRKKKDRPITSLLFAGISGTGKTEVARQLGLSLARNEKDDQLLQINCGEYGESHQLARLTGAPAGYVGYEEGNLFQSFLEPDRIQVILFDEIEKANPKMALFLLSILEDGQIAGSNNYNMDFRNTVIILTSNIGSSELAQAWANTLGFDTGQHTYNTSAIIKKVEKQFPVEFINRLSDIIIFKELTPEEMLKIANLELTKLKDRVDHIAQLQWTPAAEMRLITGLPREHGARPIRQKVEDIEASISQVYLEGSLRQNDPVELDIHEGELTIGFGGQRVNV